MRLSIIILLFAGGTMAAARWSNVGIPEPTNRTIVFLKTKIPAFYQSAKKLHESIERLNNDSVSISDSKKLLKSCRLQYKKLSFWLEYFFPIQAQAYNSPAKFEVENSSTEYEPPHGLQQIESLLFSSNPAKSKNEILEEAKIVMESARDMESLLYHWTPSYDQVFESIRLELIRVMTLYPEGYDAPFLKSGISESIQSLESISEIFSYYVEHRDVAGKSISRGLQHGIQYLQNHCEFESFDRLKFLRDFMLPLDAGFNSYINARIPERHYRSIFDRKFSADSNSQNTALEKLGNKLFFEKVLSGNQSRSCASCHVPSKYFTDGLAKNFVLGKDSLLPRNTPTLIYAQHQSRQFWDGRAASLKDQIKIVLTGNSEMNSSAGEIEEKLNNNLEYKKEFAKVFHLENDKRILMDQVCVAIASFVSSLSPMQSNFDRYMTGNDQAISTLQKKGFNLFAGKAQCASCHFIPFFNGLIPPLYNRSEFEVLGVPATSDLKNPSLDYDSGYYVVSPNWFNRGAFKTPTIRNIARTGPYMHNGAFKSLDQVLEFYDKGGGLGIGLPVTNQTLPDKSLGLTDGEKKAVVAFLESLTDPGQAFGGKIEGLHIQAHRK
ncbi:MAG: cytochrome C peroxidase [Bacteroidetes bacterium]|nr:MAG: cytochrome C peroxidase [Bacteroidota bacterium]